MPRPATGKKGVNCTFYLPPALLKEAHHLARSNGECLSSVIKTLLQRWVRRTATKAADAETTTA